MMPGWLICPQCGDVLGESRWRCDACGTAYQSLRGIPDLRIDDDLYLPNHEDWEFARRLDAEFDRRDFRGLLEYYFDLSPDIPRDLRRRQIAHILSATERGRNWISLLDPLERREPILDLGCGSGSFLVVAARECEHSVGIDIALRWLLLARKRLDEEGLTRVRLVCGEAERLPFAPGAIANIVGGDVIEHVRDQAATLAEAHRVLRPRGKLILATPNRYSLAPEPHVGVWGVGYLPRQWMAPYVRWRRGIAFRAIRTMGLAEWNRMLRSSPFDKYAIRAPGLPAAEMTRFGPLKRMIARAYNGVVRTRVGQVTALRIGPLFHVSCLRGCESPPTASPPIRSDSRSQARVSSTEAQRVLSQRSPA
jgi:SAM-dependent methyltransferase